MTTTNAEAAETPVDPISNLKRLPRPQKDNHYILAGNSSALTSLLVHWFPVVAVFCYGLVAPWLSSPWDQNNLVLVLGIWLAIWLALAGFTAVTGTGRHMYALDLSQRRITHLNSGESTSLALELYSNAEGDRLDLKTPLDSGWHLQTYTRAVAELEEDDISRIPHWQCGSLADHIQRKAMDGSLLGLFIFATLFFGMTNLIMGTMRVFLLSEIYLLVAWLVSQSFIWFLERRDRQLEC
ncbi:hypothetical protein [Marinobacter confluentis]|uniref:Uncharacterized protein n=1 Tax=Marinobacter confluentis TaxID=1697557 RepID=A0A4Z1C1E2_9GAMM|nr:hypothetical protein [Marinobacter confluentis]TGN39951.1 hypothetical protein E5Q11_06550 [Marinobacter confluentis]